jgi:frizzled protein 3
MASFLVLTVAWMLAACAAVPMDADASSHSMFTCEPITLRMCQGLPYNSTFMPNVLNHYDQQTAALAMEVRCCGARLCPNSMQWFLYVFGCMGSYPFRWLKEGWNGRRKGSA